MFIFNPRNILSNTFFLNRGINDEIHVKKGTLIFEVKQLQKSKSSAVTPGLR